MELGFQRALAGLQAAQERGERIERASLDGVTGDEEIELAGVQTRPAGLGVVGVSGGHGIEENHAALAGLVGRTHPGAASVQWVAEISQSVALLGKIA